MPADLELAIHDVQVRFGGQALQRAARLPSPQPWPCGVEAVDRLSGIGGLPRGRLAVLQGKGSSGKLSLGLALLAQATRDFARAVVVDPRYGFDPWALQPLQPDLQALTVLRPPDAAAAGEAAIALAKAGAGFMLLLRCPAEAALAQLEAVAARSGTVVAAVVESAPAALAHASSLTLGLERTAWVRERGLLVGLHARVSCLKNKVAAPGAVSELEVRYPLGARIFPGEVAIATVGGVSPFDARPLREVLDMEVEREAEEAACEARSAAG